MTQPTLLPIDRLPVDSIEVRGRLRPVSDAAVEALIASIGELGVMKDAVHVRRVKDGRNVLIAGAHRLEAARRLGWPDVPAKVWRDVTDDWARLLEIDDNIAGSELSPLDTAVFLARRKDVYERLHPETRRGVAGAARRWDATEPGSVAFVAATAEKFGLTERQVYKIVAAGSALSDEDVQLLRSAPRPVTLKDLTGLAKVRSAAERHEVALALAHGDATSVADAIKTLRGGAAEGPVQDAVEAAFHTLLNAWRRAPRAARRRFAAALGDEIAALAEEEQPE